MDREKTDPRRYRAAQTVLAYGDENRMTLHVLDGGLADNIGLRSVIQSLASTDRPVGQNPTAARCWRMEPAEHG